MPSRAATPQKSPGRWRGFRSVLCAVDFSETSATALEYAAVVARRAGTPLSVAYANDPLLVAAAAAALHSRDIAKRSEEELRDFVNAVLRGPQSARDIVFDVSVGPPPLQIIAAARRRHADLIVLGSHGLTAADRALMGSTTRGVLQRTMVPVLAIPRTATRAAPHPAWPGNRVLAAIDLEGVSAADIARASAVARWFDASLILVHVVPDLAAPDWLRPHVSPSADVVSAVRRRLERLAARQTPAAEVRVLTGRLDDEVAALATAERADLIITTLRNRRRWFASARGTMSYYLLTGTIRPVLALPSDRRR